MASHRDATCVRDFSIFIKNELVMSFFVSTLLSGMRRRVLKKTKRTGETKNWTKIHNWQINEWFRTEFYYFHP